MEENYDPPSHLSERAASLWRDVVPRRAKSPGRLAVIQAALEALDRAEAARAEVASSGMTTTTETTGAVHAHPMLKIERDARTQFTKLWGELGYSMDTAGGDKKW